MMGMTTAIWEKYVEFKHEWLKITTTALVSPLLYLIALGWGLGASSYVADMPYIDFLVPGIIALTTMNNGFSSVGLSLNVQRLFEHSFDQIIISPTPIGQYLLGQTVAGALRGMYAGCLVLIVSLLFGANVAVSPAFFLVMFLNGMLFAALGTLAAILATTHSDISRFSTFVILPMTFLCNTFFPVEKVPALIRKVIDLLPLTHASGLLRSLSSSGVFKLSSMAVLIAYTMFFLALSTLVVHKRRNL